MRAEGAMGMMGPADWALCFWRCHGAMLKKQPIPAPTPLPL
jgi:hypothetical protein